MMWSVGILLAAALSVESYAVHDINERLAHGRQLKIYLPKSAEKLEFIPADEPGQTFSFWEKGKLRMTKGRVSGTSSNRHWYIDKVTYEDQGTYVQRDFWDKELSTIKVAVTPRHNYVKCVAGESLYISLEGIDPASAGLSFSGEAANVTLVHDGARVSQDLPDYWDRVDTHSMNIEIRHVNHSDEGRYTLRDRRDRVVSITRMDLTDHRESSGNPLMALLLLLGIPAGICCCCRKKIFRKKSSAAPTLQTSPEALHLPPGGPVAPCPPYGPPGQSAEPFYYDPNMGFSPAYPPQNASYPSAGPAFIPPNQPPQWIGPPQGQHPPGPAAPMGHAPVMYSSPPAVEEEVKMMKMNDSPADLYTTGQSGVPCPPPVPSSSDAAYQFQIDGVKTSSNFL